MANWKKITTDADLTAISASLTTTDQAISASVAALSGSASTARGLLGGGGGTTINTTDNVIPVRSDATTFVDSPITVTSGQTTISSDLTVSGSAEITGSLGVTGSVGYSFVDTTTGPGVGAWSTGGAMLRATTHHASATSGTQTAALSFGSGNILSTSRCTDEYNGTSWSAGGALIGYTNLGFKSLAGAGTQNAALAFGGCGYDDNTYETFANTCTEEYNGASWSAGGTLSNPRYCLGGIGIQNSALAFGGSYVDGGSTECTEEYNGTSWSDADEYIGAGADSIGAGTVNALIAMQKLSVDVYEYNGSSWSNGNNMSIGGDAATGTQNAALVFGGRIGSNYIYTEKYDGTSWSAGGALITGRHSMG